MARYADGAKILRKRPVPAPLFIFFFAFPCSTAAVLEHTKWKRRRGMNDALSWNVIARVDAADLGKFQRLISRFGKLIPNVPVAVCFVCVCVCVSRVF